MSGLYFSAPASFLLQSWRRHSPAQTLLARTRTLHACAADSLTPPRHCLSALLARIPALQPGLFSSPPPASSWSAPLTLSRCRHAGLAVLPLSVGQCPALLALPLYMAPARCTRKGSVVRRERRWASTGIAACEFFPSIDPTMQVCSVTADLRGKLCALALFRR